MAMAIMRNNVNTKPLLAKMSRLSLCMIGLMSLAAQAKVTLTPSLQTSAYSYEIYQADSKEADRGSALELLPALRLDYSNAWLQSSVNVENKTFFYRDAQRDNESYATYQLSNNASFLRDQLQLRLNSQRNYRSSGNRTASYVDELTGGDRIARTDFSSFGLGYQNQHFDWFHTQLDLNATESSSDQSFDSMGILIDGEATDLTNQTLGARLAINSRDRNALYFWGMELDSRTTKRETAADYTNRSGYAIVGVPFFWRVGMIAQGRYENNDNLSGSAIEFGDFHSVGGGLEWKITNRSWWNITFNKVNDSLGTKEYLGTEFSLQPSSRTTLSGALDERFFGRSAQITGSYELKRLRMSVTVSDTVASLLALSNEMQDLGLFVCPAGATPGLANCFQPPTPQYRPSEGESFYQLSGPTGDLNEAIVVRRNGTYNIGYTFRKTAVQLQFGQRKDTYLERNTETKDNFVNMTLNYTLNGRNNLTFSTDYSDLKYSGAGISAGLAGEQLVNSLSWSRTINTELTADLNFRRVDADYTDNEFDFQENRLGLSLNYQF